MKYGVTLYALAIQGHGVAELTSGYCVYRDYREAEKRLKEYHSKGMDYMRIFYLHTQDDDDIAVKQAEALRGVA